MTDTTTKPAATPDATPTKAPETPVTDTAKSSSEPAKIVETKPSTGIKSGAETPIKPVPHDSGVPTTPATKVPQQEDYHQQQTAN